MHVGLGLERVRCVLCEMLRSPRRMTLRFLRWREATKSMSSSHSVRTAEEDGSGFMYALMIVVRPRGVRMSKECQRL